MHALKRVTLGNVEMCSFDFGMHKKVAGINFHGGGIVWRTGIHQNRILHGDAKIWILSSSGEIFYE